MTNFYNTKQRKKEILSKMAEISDSLDVSGNVYLADLITECMESVASGQSIDVTDLKKVADLLDQKREFDLAEQVDDLLPDIIELKSVKGVKRISSRKTLCADRAFQMATTYHQQYMSGYVDENSFEYAKMKELESMLKTGFLLPMPKSYESIPTNSKNWWEHFSKEKKDV